jgi:hypothetical protein
MSTPSPVPHPARLAVMEAAARHYGADNIPEDVLGLLADLEGAERGLLALLRYTADLLTNDGVRWTAAEVQAGAGLRLVP